MSGHLDNLLARLRDGTASAAELEAARALVAEDPRIPDELRGELLQDDPAGDAEALLGMFGLGGGITDLLRAAVLAEAGADALDAPTPEMLAEIERPLPIALVAALHWEAGTVDVAVAVAQELGFPALDLAGAIRAAAGPIDVADAVCAELGIARLPLAEAVRAEAGVAPNVVFDDGDPALLSGLLDAELPESLHVAVAQRVAGDAALRAALSEFADLGRAVRQGVAEGAGELASVWAGVAAEIGVADPEAVPGWDGAVFAEALRAEAGEVDVVAAVMAEVAREVAARRTDVSELPVAPAAANDARGWMRWGFSVVAAAAVALLVATGVQSGFWHDAGSVQVAVAPLPAPVQMAFASASDVVVDDLSFGDSVQVMQVEGDEGAVILWVDEGV